MNAKFSKRYGWRVAVLGAVAFFASDFAVRADALFNLTDGTNDIRFTLANPTTLGQTGVCATDPDLACAFNVPLTVNGTNSLANYIAFYDAADLGGLTIYSGSQYLLSQSGTVLFTGPLTMPTFQLGTTNLFNYSDFDSIYKGDFLVNITSASAVPEPSSIDFLLLALALMIGIVGRVALFSK